MDHYKNPRNCGELPDATFCVEQRNSACGDEVVYSGIVKDGVVIAVKWNGKGCVISQAMASMLSERVIGMPQVAISSLDHDYLVALIGMPLGPVRMQCALLPLLALQKV